MHYEVKDFMSIAGQFKEGGDSKQTALQIGLILEEVAELLEAQDCAGQAETITTLANQWKKGMYVPAKNVDTLDAFLDIAWVSLGGAWAMGADVGGAVDALSANNISKFDRCPNCSELTMGDEEFDNCHVCDNWGLVANRDANGKVIKPADYQKLDLSEYLTK